MSNGAAPALLAALASFGIAELLTGSTRPVVLLSQPLLVVGLVVWQSPETVETLFVGICLNGEPWSAAALRWAGAAAPAPCHCA